MNYQKIPFDTIWFKAETSTDTFFYIFERIFGHQQKQTPTPFDIWKISGHQQKQARQG